MSSKPRAEDILTRTRAFLHGSPQFDPAWPQDPESEKATVCCLLLAPKEVAARMQTKGVTRDYFYDSRYQTLATSIIELINSDRANGERIDFLVLANKLKEEKKLDGIGGGAVINELFNFLPSAANANAYLDILIRKYALRWGAQTAFAIAAASLEHQADWRETLEGLQKVALQCAAIGTKAVDATIRDQVVKLLNKREQHETGRIQGLSTHLPALDHWTGGICPGHLIVIGGKGKTGKSRGSGKTSYATDLFRHMLYVHQQPAIMLQMEMSNEEVLYRMVSGWSGIPLRKLMNKAISIEDETIAQQWFAWLSSLRSKIDDTGRLNIGAVAAKLRAFKALNPSAKLAVIDYFQLIECRYRKEWTQAQIAAELSGVLKGLARELEMAIVVLSQLNDKGDTLGGKALENEADRVEIIEHSGDETFIRLEKNRHGDDKDAEGEAIRIPVEHDRDCVRFLAKNAAA